MLFDVALGPVVLQVDGLAGLENDVVRDAGVYEGRGHADDDDGL